MMRHVVLGALVGFGTAVLLLAAFGTGGGLVPLLAAPDAGGPVPKLEAFTPPQRLAPLAAPALRRPAFVLMLEDAGSPDASR